jgi:hypothetical protein
MTVLVQYVIVVLLIAGAAAFLLWSAWRTWRSGGAAATCGGSCGCGKERKREQEPVIPLGLKIMSGRKPHD